MCSKLFGCRNVYKLVDQKFCVRMQNCPGTVNKHEMYKGLPRAKWSMPPELIFGFSGIKQLGVLLISPDGMLVA